MRFRFFTWFLSILGTLILAGCAASAPTTAPAASQPGTLSQMSVTELKAKLDAGEKLFLLDVRTPEEFSQDGHVAQAVLIPLDQLKTRLGELPADTPIACICRSGNRSTTACTDLVAQGYEATNVTGGMISWKASGLPVVAP